MKKHCVEKFLVSSYIYYVLYEETPMTDCEFDSMCCYMLDNWAEIEHKYKYMITEDMLEAGTGHNISASSYPEEIVDMANAFVAGEVYACVREKT